MGMYIEALHMEPAIWGPKMWDVLFSCAFRLPRERAIELFGVMKDLIPCPRCRRHYQSHHERVAIGTTQDAPFRWLWTIRDMVNQTLGQRSLAFTQLELRHRTLSAPISAFDVLDCMAVMALVLDDAHCDAYWRAFALFRECLHTMTPLHSSMLTDPDDAHRSPATAWLHILACKNALLVHVGLPPQGRDSWIAQYEHCKAVETAKPPVSSTSRRRRR